MKIAATAAGLVIASVVNNCQNGDTRAYLSGDRLQADQPPVR